MYPLISCQHLNRKIWHKQMYPYHVPAKKKHTKIISKNINNFTKYVAKLHVVCLMTTLYPIISET